MKATFVIMKQHFSMVQFSILYKGVLVPDGLRLVELLQVKIKFRLKFFNLGWFSISIVL